MDGYLTTEQVAAKTGLTTSYIRRMARQMQIGVKASPRSSWLFTPAEIEAMSRRETVGLSDTRPRHTTRGRRQIIPQ